MTTPVKSILSKLRRPPAEPEAEPDVGTERLSALRQRAAVAEDPHLVELMSGDFANDDSPEGRGTQPIVLVRQLRVDDTPWDNSVTSWFGGCPKLGAIEWPRDSHGIPMPFVAQISLADLAAGRADNPLPRTGSLAFFLGDGAVIHVPDGVTQFSQAPDDLPPSRNEGGEVCPQTDGPLNRALFPFWPVEPVALVLPVGLRNHLAAELHEDIRVAMNAALGDVPRRDAPFSAAQSLDHPVPVWWQGVDYVLDHLRDALSRAEDRPAGLPALIGALEGFAAERDPWTELSAEEHEVFVEALGNIHDQFHAWLDPSAPKTVEDLATVSLRAMMTGDAAAFAGMPAAARADINRAQRLPVLHLPQMFGLPADIGEPMADHAADMLLLQLPADDLLDWNFGEIICQFWIHPEDLAERRWEAVRLSFYPAA